jgi:hypothetical protein
VQNRSEGEMKDEGCFDCSAAPCPSFLLARSLTLDAVSSPSTTVARRSTRGDDAGSEAVNVHATKAKGDGK